MVVMRALMLGLLAYTLPFSATAAPWCSVSATDAAAVLPSVTQRLTPLLDSTPKPMAHIHTEGTLPHQGIRDESIEAKKQLPIMRDAAFAWRAGAGEAYFQLAQRYLNAWVSVYQPNFNPIDETNFDALIETYAVIAPKMDAKSKAAADTFLRAWAKGYIASIEARKIVSVSPQATTWDNNWQSHRIKLITMIAVALDDPALFADARRLFQAQVQANIKPNGETIDFAERDALHYVIYGVEPLGQATLAARLKGEDWFNYQAPSGSSVARVFVWMKPYATGEKPHEEFKNSKVLFDRQRFEAGQKEYSGPFEPKSAGNVYWLASVFDPAYLALAQQLKPEPPTYLSMCGA
jgi:hypothetical protein